MNQMEPSALRRPGVVAAMILGTALTTLGSASATATASHPAEVQSVGDISRYCTVCWRNARLHPDCWTDCTQEVFTRLLERVAPDDWDRILQAEGEERREFFRAIDAVKKRAQRVRKYGSIIPDAVADGSTVRSQKLAEDWEAVSHVSAEVLTPRQQRIMQMSFEGWSVHEVATELKVPAERVSDEKYKAIRKLRQHLHRG